MIEKPLRKAIKESGLSAREIARKTGVDATLIGRFLRSERTMTLPTAERLSKFLGMELVKSKKKRSHLTTKKK